ncbi:MAG: apolipoprotein N-acyltransferase [Candidatus Omnitrophica bacterium]|nr:apolipoprotein N-acyltransferase [Candidatus Omnitrophota bacterium]
MKINKKIWSMIFLSSLLLILAFPKTDWYWLAWIAFVPLFVVCETATLKESFWRFFWSGFVFFLGAFYWIGISGLMVGMPWLAVLTFLGTVLLCGYLALYFGLFGIMYFYRRKILLPLFVLPAFWVILEFFRSIILSGFGWGALGYSQYKNLPVIQIADVTAVYGVSFAVFFVNLCFYKAYFYRRELFKVAGWILVSLATIGWLWWYGLGCIKYFDKSSASIKVAVVQGNVPQDQKWDEKRWPAIMDKYTNLTKQALVARPDLLIWPETAFPGILWEDEKYFEILKTVASENKIPILVGSVVAENNKYFNSALLLGSDGALAGRYDKIHLVPFGEYVPFREQAPILGSLIPITDFTSGTKTTILDFNKVRFAVLICFEDTIPELVRQFVDTGAQFLVNITNDAWFADTKSPYLHLQSSVFRAVENRRSVVRAANTGISCFISPYGKIIRYLMDAKGKATYVEGIAQDNVEVSSQRTFYTRHGNVFIFICIIFFLLGMIGFLIKRRAQGE